MITTEQETFWQGEFGNGYTDRNRGTHWVASNFAFFSMILSYTRNIQTVLELGANIGLNLAAIKQLLPNAKLAAVEINHKAVTELKQIMPDVEVYHTSILEFQPTKLWDLIFTKNVLIHINPSRLPEIYSLIYKSSSQYILLCEHYSRKPIEADYRGHTGYMFKRDFAGEMLDSFPALELVRYGFVYHRDMNFPQDDTTWFLLKKK